MRYIRKPIDYALLDDVGHGVKVRARHVTAVVPQPFFCRTRCSAASLCCLSVIFTDALPAFEGETLSMRRRRSLSELGISLFLSGRFDMPSFCLSAVFPPPPPHHLPTLKWMKAKVSRLSHDPFCHPAFKKKKDSPFYLDYSTRYRNSCHVVLVSPLINLLIMTNNPPPSSPLNATTLNPCHSQCVLSSLDAT